VKLQHSWALIVGAPHRSSKASESGTNAPSSSTIRLSKYCTQPITPYLPFPSPANHNLDRFGWRSSRSLEGLLLLRASHSPYNIFFLIEIPVLFSLHTIDLIPSFRFASVLARQAPPKSLPAVHGPLLTRLCVSILRLGVNSISLPRGSRIGYDDVMICTTSMRRHALLLIALAHTAS